MNQPNTTETYYSKFSKPNHLSDSEIIEEIKEFWKEAKELPVGSERRLEIEIEIADLKDWLEDEYFGY